MTSDSLRLKLWNKVSNDFEKFKNQQLTESKETIFDNAYMISMLQEFTNMCDPKCFCLKDNEVKYLLKEPYPARTLCNLYLKADVGGTTDLYESIWNRLNDLVEKKINKKTDIER